MDASEIIQPKKRQTALKFKIADLNRGEVISNDKQNFVEINGNHVGRVNVIANVIDKFASEGEKKYSVLTIDDASSQIRIKAFGEDVIKMKNVEIGDTILVIGFLRFFNNEIYILPEIIRKTEPEWLLIRKLELEKMEKNNPSIKSPNLPSSPDNRISRQLKNVEMTEEQKNAVKNIAFNNSIDVKQEKIELSAKEKILDILRQNEEGIDRDKIIMSTNLPVGEINKTIDDMLENAEIYEPKPGRIRLL